MFINTDTLQRVTEQDIRAAHPNTSFATPFSPPDGYAVLFASPQPTYNPVTQLVRETTPTQIDGQWFQQWEAASRFVEYMDEQGVTHTVAEQETAALLADQAAKAKALQDSIVQQTQNRLNTFANTRGYDSTDSISKYKDISDAEIALLPADEQPLVTKFRAECRYVAVAAARTWAKLYLMLAEVEAGTRPVPTGFADVEPELPELKWPV